MNKYSFDKDVSMVEDGSKQSSSREHAKKRLIQLENLQIEIKIIHEEIRISGVKDNENWTKGLEVATMEMKRYVMTMEKTPKDWNIIRNALMADMMIAERRLEETEKAEEVEKEKLARKAEINELKSILEEKDKKFDELLRKIDGLSLRSNGFIHKPRCRTCGRYHFGICLSQNKSKEYLCLKKELNYDKIKNLNKLNIKSNKNSKEQSEKQEKEKIDILKEELKHH